MKIENQMSNWKFPIFKVLPNLKTEDLKIKYYAV